MQISRGALISYMAFAPLAFAPIAFGPLLFGQEGPSNPANPPTSATAAPAAPMPPSSVIQPALSSVESTLSSLKIDKWKKGSIREEAGENVNAILKDLKSNVPPLMADADSAPGALSKSLPLMKHLDALYDVVLRVEEGARVSAPSEQVDQLASVLKQFGSARIQLYDSMTERAGLEEKRVTDLQTEIKAQKAAAEEHKAAPAPAAVPCTPPKPAPRRKRATPPKTVQPAPGQPAQTPPAQPKPQ
ncbi:MAG TPA: hypothetical protein VGL00_09875 [Terracidiphilus sp.]